MKFSVHQCLSDNLGPKINIHSLESRTDGGEGREERKDEREEGKSFNH